MPAEQHGRLRCIRQCGLRVVVPAAVCRVGRSREAGLFFHSLFAFCANAFGSDCIMENVDRNLRFLFIVWLESLDSCCYTRYLIKFRPA